MSKSNNSGVENAKTMRGVIYARYSSDNQREESIEGQIRDCRSFAMYKGIEIVDTYIDRALSARSDDRPSFQKMINDSYEDKFDAVIVWKSDRFSRNRRQAMDYRDILKKNHVIFLSATEVNLDGPENILIEGMRDSYNEYYSAELSLKIRRGERENVLEGKYNGGVIPFGYLLKDGKLVEDPEKAPIVTEIFREYATTDCSINSLCNELRERGVRGKNGKPIPHSTLFHILSNDLYAGVYDWGENVNKGCYPILVDQDTFDAVQEKMRKNGHHSQIYRSGAKKGFLLTNKLYCGRCGEKMTGYSGTGRNHVYQYYRCKNSKNHQCDMPKVPKEWIEDFVVRNTLECLKDRLGSAGLVDSICEMENAENPVIKSIETNTSSLDAKMVNIMHAIENGMDPNDFKARYAELKDEKVRLERSLEMEKEKNPIIDREKISSFINKYRDFDVRNHADKQSIIDHFVNSVYVDGNLGFIDIAYNFRTRTNRMEGKEWCSSSAQSAPPF